MQMTTLMDIHTHIHTHMRIYTHVPIQLHLHNVPQIIQGKRMKNEHLIDSSQEFISFEVVLQNGVHNSAEKRSCLVRDF